MGTRLPSLVLFGSLLIAGACGGGDGEDPYVPPPPPPGPEAAFRGVYYMGGYTLGYTPGDLLDPGGHPTGMWGVALADGAGGQDLTYNRNVETVLDPETLSGSYEYTVSTDQLLEMLHPIHGVPVMRGGVATDGRFASWAKIQVDESPTLMVFGRRGGSYGIGSLDGAYVMCACSFDFVSASVLYGGVAFDGAGVGAGPGHRNAAGVTSGPFPVNVTYDVAGNGDTTLEILPILPMRGGTVAGGDVVLLGGATGDGDPPILCVFVKGSSGRSDADLDGTYWLVGYQYDVSEDDYISITGTLTADGVGGFTTSLTLNDGDVLLEDVPGGGSYVLSSAGVLLITNTLGSTYTGALSPDGSCAVVAGAINTGHDPAFYFLHR